MKVVALLPIKHESERVPNKNFRKINGLYLFEHILKKLVFSELIDYVVINTDSSKVQNILKTKKYPNVHVHVRPMEICGNYVSMNKIIEHDIKLIDADIFIQTHSTNPLLKLSTINNAINSYISNMDDYDSVFSVSKVQKRFYTKDCLPYNHDPNMLTTQHLDAIFEENSCFYIFCKNSFFQNNKNRIGKKPFMFETEKIESIDIDSEEDLLIVKSLLKK